MGYTLPQDKLQETQETRHLLAWTSGYESSLSTVIFMKSSKLFCKDDIKRDELSRGATTERESASV